MAKTGLWAEIQRERARQQRAREQEFRDFRRAQERAQREQVRAEKVAARKAVADLKEAFGGLCVIQAKRSRYAVGIDVVRALAGTAPVSPGLASTKFAVPDGSPGNGGPIRRCEAVPNSV